jgi:hypothetical protein
MELQAAPDFQVWTFFYGSYLNLHVLRELNIVPQRWEVARLSGFDIRILPHANIVRANPHCVYGIVATASHGELDRLYSHAKDILGETYLPRAVLVETADDKWRPALCYIAPVMEPSTATNEYIDRIVRPAKEYGFPEWYIKRLESFRP